MTAADGAPVRGDRIPLAGRGNFTIMYAAHDAFTRGLRRLTNACTAGRACTPHTAATWARFKAQLQIHHRAEDIALWPQLRAAVAAPEALAVPDAMEAEHARIDPALGAVDAACAAGDQAGLAESIGRLSAGMATHMRHGAATGRGAPRHGWLGNVHQAHPQHAGIRGGAEFFRWLLDEAPTPARDRVLQLVPPPVRLLNRRVWAPRDPALAFAGLRPPRPFRSFVLSQPWPVRRCLERGTARTLNPEPTLPKEGDPPALNANVTRPPAVEPPPTGSYRIDPARSTQAVQQARARHTRQHCQG